MQAVGGATLTTHETVDAADTTPPVATDPAARTRSWRWFGLIVLTVLAVDLAVKHWTVTTLAGRESIRVLGGGLYLLHVRNGGAAFSLGRDYTFIFPIIAFFVCGWILWMAYRLASTPWAIALGLVLGGAAGNLGDRLFRAPGPFQGHVVDMFSVFGDHGEYFPVFNVADASLSVGVGLAVLLEFTGRRRDGTREVRQKAGAGDDAGTAGRDDRG